ncbi:hypothetical protein COP2_044410 [Malus domestica]
MTRVLAIYITLAFSLFLCGTECNISFSTSGATSNSYNTFIKALRAQLTNGATAIYDIPVLNPSVPDSQRFLLVDLSNNGNNTITVAIDVVNASVVAYRARAARPYFLADAPDEALDILFNDTRGFFLPFTSNYIDLEKAAEKSRDKIPLGLTPLHNAITSLWNQESEEAAVSLLVIIQTVFEAARFRVIEQRVRNSISSKANFIPDPAMLSLENHWLAISWETQHALNGVFSKSIQLRSTNNNLFLVDSVSSSIMAGVAFLFYNCYAVTFPNIIKMPVNVVMGKEIDSEICAVQNRTTRISGLEGLCIDVKNGLDNDGNLVQIWPCGQQRNQKWTFQPDETIRSMEKCMTAYSTSSPKNYVMIYNCTTAVPEATKWALSTDGTITHRRSGLVLTAHEATQGTTLTIATNSHSPKQGWRVADDVEPTVTSIIGYSDMCLTANDDKSRVWMEYCVPSKNQQQWALYSEGTIRVNSDRTLCVTSNGHNSSNVIIILKCELKRGDQRWVFKTDGSILNPNAELVMDVKNSDVYLRQIILYPYYGTPNQQWLPFF